VLKIAKNALFNITLDHLEPCRASPCFNNVLTIRVNLLTVSQSLTLKKLYMATVAFYIWRRPSKENAKIAHAGINCKGYINGRELFAFSGPAHP